MVFVVREGSTAEFSMLTGRVTCYKNRSIGVLGSPVVVTGAAVADKGWGTLQGQSFSDPPIQVVERLRKGLCGLFSVPRLVGHCKSEKRYVVLALRPPIYSTQLTYRMGKVYGRVRLVVDNWLW